ncbi:MAG TPA: hypothetical protein VGP48_14335 [Stellaceae bacterium]|jgi:hypothetical protein|nr:hypothetical protein [Stellaceae bacterium]
MVGRSVGRHPHLVGAWIAVAVMLLLLAAQNARAAPTGIGVNYLTGEGVDQLNCDASNTAQIAKDMAELKSLGTIKWVRIETAMTAVSGLPNPPSCPRPAHEFDNLQNLLAGIASIGAQPILDILEWHYTPALEAPYAAWLDRLLAAAPGIAVFELADEENLSVRVESYRGANPNQEPYGWDFDPHDFANNDAVGLCPKDTAKASNLDAAVKTYVAWLKASDAIIKTKNRHATVMLGGLSSWQAQCWLEKLGALHAERYADAIGYHPYPRYAETAPDAAATLDTLTQAMARWSNRLPIWVTEFGFTTSSAFGGSAVPDEATKAQDIAQEVELLRQSLSGPIVMYTARDGALTAAEWAQQCPGQSCPGGMGGFGLFEWDDGVLTVEPAAAAFAEEGAP